jgi:subtilisin family serine protease
MNESHRPSFSLRDILAQVRRRIPWWPTKPPIDRPSPDEVAAERLRVQVGVIRRRFRGVGEVAAAGPDGRRTEEDADAAFLYQPGVALVRDNTEERPYYQEFLDFFGRRTGEFDESGPVRREDRRLPAGLVMVTMPSRSDRGDEVLDTLREIDDERLELGLEDVVAQPDHILYVTVQGHYCPFTEPEEPPVDKPLPAVSSDASAGKDIRVSVVDTGLWVKATTKTETKWLAGVTPADPDDEEIVNSSAIHEYAGHGTFVAGIVKCLAPGATIEVEGALPNGGAVFESDICEELQEALRDRSDPHLISISAGTHTRANMGLLGLEILAETHGLTDGTKGLVVAAAGNDSSDVKFYPAAFPWVISVGALDEAGNVAPYSNYGEWVDVWARGSNLINAFPEGTYTCSEPPNTGQVRNFKHLAQWSGTSFATPIVTGAIAAQMSTTGNTDDPKKAFDQIDKAAPKCPDPKAGGGKHLGPL